MTASFVLIHSPLVGPSMWYPVADHLQRAGVRVVVPELDDVDGSGLPYWYQHATAVGRALASLPPDQPLVLVAHSGAGPLLPAIRDQTSHSIVAYLFVDAGLPHPGISRLDEMLRNVPTLGTELQQHLVAGGRFPEWSNDDLRQIVPDDRLRRALVAELHPRSLDFFTESLPPNRAWPDALCGYIKFSAAYAQPAEQARSVGWPIYEFGAGHFHMLVDSATVASSLIALVETLSTRAGYRPSPA